MADRLEQLLKLHAVDPADADVPYMIALEHAKAGAAGEAIAWLDKAITTDPGHLYAYYQKGRLLSEQGDTDAAKQAIQAGLQHAQTAGDAKAASELSELLASIDH